MSPRRTLWLSITLILVIALAACGAKPTGEGAGPEAAQPTAATTPTTKPAEESQPTAAPASAAATATATEAATAEAAGGTEDPEPNTVAKAAAIEPGTTSASLIEGDEDWFTISVPASGILTVALAPDGGAQPMEITLSEVGGSEIWHEYNVQPSATKAISQILSSAEGVDYAVMVTGGPGRYALDVTIESQDDAGSGGDAGDSPASALPLLPGKTYTGMIGDRDEEDLYKLELKAGTVVTVTFAPLSDSGGLDVAFLSADMNESWREYSVTKGAARSYAAILSHGDAGAYYVRVLGDKGEYQLQIATEMQTDAGSGQDAGDKAASAVAVELGKSYTGLIGDLDWQDLYRFEAKGGDIIDITFTPDGDAEPMDVAVLDRDQDEMWREWSVGPGSTKAFSHILDADAGGTYYVTIIGGRGTYNLDLSAGAQNDAGSGRDAGSRPADAVEIEPNASYSGQIGGSDLEDMYSFEVPGGSVISITFTLAKDADRMDVALLDLNLDELWREWSVAPGVTKAATYVVGVDRGGPYYLWVGDPYGQDSYTFEITVAGQMDGGWDGDAGDTPEDAVPVEPDTEFSGIVGDDDWQDYYQFEPEEGQTISFTPSRDTEAMDVFVLDADENYLFEEYSVRAGRTVTFEIEQIEGETPYYILVVGGRGTYTILIEPAP